MLRLNTTAILQIDEKILHLSESGSEHQASELRGRRNRLVPLGQLPPELLGRILYHTLWHDSRPAIYETVKLHDIYRPTWVQSTLACRHVRAVALQTPKLWTVITDTLCENRARWAAVCAKRAGASPLTIISSVLCKQHAVRFLPDAVWTAAGAIEMQANLWQPLSIGWWMIEMPEVLPQQQNIGALDRPLPRLQHLQLSINASLSPHLLAGSSVSEIVHFYDQT
jgi:hypothetical protein